MPTHACLLSHFSRVQLFVTLWTVAHQASLSIGFSRQGHWNGLPFPPPEDLPNPGIEPVSLKSPALAGTCIGKVLYHGATHVQYSSNHKMLKSKKKSSPVTQGGMGM